MGVLRPARLGLGQVDLQQRECAEGAEERAGFVGGAEDDGEN
jgi:hypothetical protein